MRPHGHNLKWGYYKERVVLVTLAILVIFLEVAEGREPRRSGGREQRRTKKSRRGVGKDFSEFLYVMGAVMTCVIAPVFTFFLYSLYEDPAVPKLARAGWEALKRTLLSYLGQDEHQQVASAIDGLRNTRTSITPYASTRRRLGENDSFSSNAIGGNHGVRSARGSAGLVLTDDRNYYSSHSAQSLTGRTQQQRPQHGLGHSPYNKDYHYNSGNGRDYDNVEYDYRFTSKIGAENSETRRMVGGEFSSAVAPFSERAAAASTRHAARPPWNEREEGNRAMLSSKSLIPTDSGYKGEDEHQWEVDFQRKYGYTGPGRGARMTTDGFFGTGMTAGNQEKGESGAPATHWRMAGGSHDAMPVAKMGTRHDGGVYKSVQSKRRRAAIAQQKSEVRQGI